MSSSMRKMIVFENGMPVPVTGKPYTKETANAATRTALALPYEPIKDDQGEIIPSERRFMGMSNGEVMNIRAVEAAARGDLDAYKYVMDRVGGKATQAVETINVNASLSEYLEALANERNQVVEVVEVREVEIPSADELLDLI